MTICCLKESGPPSSDSHSDGDGDINLEIPKLSEVLGAINVVGVTTVRNVVVLSTESWAAAKKVLS